MHLVRIINPNVANLCRKKSVRVREMGLRRLGQAEAYLTVREVLAEVSTGADVVLWREFSGLGRFRFATLGLR